MKESLYDRIMRYAAEYEHQLAGARARTKRWNKANPEQRRLLRAKNARSQRIRRPEKFLDQRRAKYATDPHPHRERAKQWRLSNPEKALTAKRNYKLNHPDRVREQQRRANAKKRLDPLFRLAAALRRRVSHALRGFAKSARTLELLGCSFEHFKAHLESQFQPGMSWDNYGIKGWHVDHKKPCVDFDLTDPIQQKLCFHYSNLQPLFALDNLSKNRYAQPKRRHAA